MTDATDARLAAQYEAYPYPARDPADEAKRLIVGSPSHLREIDHWVFGATRPASRPFRALIAGGGTGDAAIMLAQHLARAGRPGRVTYLDRSGTAMGIARARAAAAAWISTSRPARCWTCPPAASVRSTTSIAAASCTTSPTRLPASPR